MSWMGLLFEAALWPRFLFNERSKTLAVGVAVPEHNLTYDLVFKEKEISLLGLTESNIIPPQNKRLNCKPGLTRFESTYVQVSYSKQSLARNADTFLLFRIFRTS